MSVALSDEDRAVLREAARIFADPETHEPARVEWIRADEAERGTMKQARMFTESGGSPPRLVIALDIETVGEVTEAVRQMAEERAW